jgi:hypothetical protein
MIRTYNVLTLDGKLVKSFSMYVLYDLSTAGKIMQKVKDIAEANDLTFDQVTWMDVTPNQDETTTFEKEI